MSPTGPIWILKPAKMGIFTTRAKDNPSLTVEQPERICRFESFDDLKETMRYNGYFICDANRVHTVTLDECIEDHYYSMTDPKMRDNLRKNIERHAVSKVLHALTDWIGRHTFEWRVPGGGLRAFASLTVILEHPREWEAWGREDKDRECAATKQLVEFHGKS
jgi:hypothetical protein